MNAIINISEATRELPPSLSIQIQNSFAPYMEKIAPLIETARSINVISVDQIEDMSRARSTRLALVKIKSAVESDRKAIKDPYLRASNAIDAVGTRLRNELDVVIKQLKVHEDFIVIQEAEKKVKLANCRRDELSKFEVDSATYGLDLGSLSETAYQMILKSAKDEHQAKIDAEEKAKIEQIETQRKEKIFTDRKIELAPYSFFADIRKLTIDTSEFEYSQMLILAKDNKQIYEAEQKKIAADQDAKRKEAEVKAKEAERLRAIEQKKREVLEAKIKKENELKKQFELDEKNKRIKEEETQRNALLAPDKTKLTQLAKQFETFQLPAVKSKEASSVIRATEVMLKKISNYILEKSNTL